tara:strand:- start:1904 stop:2737 length:834 start_codon:yes stop_codon:yes gene_type:complete
MVQVDCCKHTKKNKSCQRKSDGEIFKLPRNFTREQCKDKKGFSMNSSCAPYDDCYKKKRTKKRTVRLPRLRPLRTHKKKHKYKLNKPFKKRILALNEGVNYEFKKNKQTKKRTAISKKGRLNILRIYRRNNNVRDCKRITRDMRYLDKKYKLGSTKDICGNQQGGREFLFNPNNPDKSFDVYIDKDTSDTIPIKFTNIEDVKQTIRKLERLYKRGEYSHKRIGQVAMILRVRLRVLKDKKPKEHRLAKRYTDFLKKRTKIKNESDRKKLQFNYVSSN